MILLIDNYDSFTYNLVQRLGEIDRSLALEVRRNDQITLDEIAALQPSHLIVSPGPCTPSEAGISVAAIERFAKQMPILGVCLGHQSIGQAFGAEIVRAKRLMHGKTDMVHHDSRGLFAGLENPLQATRYHSLVIRPGTLSGDFEVCPGATGPTAKRRSWASGIGAGRCTGCSFTRRVSSRPVAPICCEHSWLYRPRAVEKGRASARNGESRRTADARGVWSSLCLPSKQRLRKSSPNVRLCLRTR